jgi:hypothetical protein
MSEDKQAFEPRRAEAGQVFTTTDAEGREQTIKADDSGVVHPTSAAEVRLLDSFDLPVARKVLREERAAARAEQASEAEGEQPAKVAGPAAQAGRE